MAALDTPAPAAGTGADDWGVADCAAGADGEPGSGLCGAETPAMSEPSPSFCSVAASSLPVDSMPWVDWNFCSASTVVASHLPLGSP